MEHNDPKRPEVPVTPAEAARADGVGKALARDPAKEGAARLSRLERLSREHSGVFRIVDDRRAERVVDGLVEQQPAIALPAVADGRPALFETATRAIDVTAGAEGVAVPLQALKAPAAGGKPLLLTPEQFRSACRQWGTSVFERLVEWAMCDDYRASLPAIAMLLNRGFGKETELPEQDPQLQLVASLPVRDRIAALLAARENGGVVQVVGETTSSSAGVGGQEPGNATASPADETISS